MGIFTMPSLGADMEAGALAEWLVKPGDEVKRGDVVAVVETQKGAIEIEIFEAGTVHELKADTGVELPVGAPLAVILAPGETPPAAAEAEPTQAAEPEPAPEPEPAAAAAPEPAPQPAPAPAAAPTAPAVAMPGHAASPAARKRAAELGLDLTTLKGTGPGGAIVLADVEGGTPAAAKKPAKPASPMEAMRAAIAAAMSRSKREIPHIYLSQTIDLQPATDWLTAQNLDRPPAQRLLMGALFTRAATLAAAKVPVLNGHYTADGFRKAAQVNPGVAVALRGGGLVAPAMFDAVNKSLDETMAAMRDLVTRARAGRLRSSEMTEGTITVSSIGETGAEAMAGIIFPPQVALVGIGAPCERPWIVDGAVVPRQVVSVTISADHRIADGRQAAKFLAAFETALSSPEDL